MRASTVVKLSRAASCAQVKEIIYPLGATIDVREIKLGDETMSVLEIWGAEYQENDALLIKPDARALLEGICSRERCSLQVGRPLFMALRFSHINHREHVLLGLATPVSAKFLGLQLLLPCVIK